MGQDRMTVRLIAAGLVAIAFAVVVGGLYLADQGRTVPQVLTALGGTALGGATSFLVSARSDPPPVPIPPVITPPTGGGAVLLPATPPT